MMITNQQVWVHAVQKAGQEPGIACLVATTRESDDVTAVTKVYTAEHWRVRHDFYTASVKSGYLLLL